MSTIDLTLYIALKDDAVSRETGARNGQFTSTRKQCSILTGDRMIVKYREWQIATIAYMRLTVWNDVWKAT